MWYMKKGHEMDARRAVLRLYGPGVDVDAKLRKELKLLESNDKVSPTSWAAIFSNEHRS